MAETLKAIQNEMVANYKALTEDEKEIIRANQDTPYAQLLKRVIPTEVFEGLPLAPVLCGSQSPRPQHLTNHGQGPPNLTNPYANVRSKVAA